MKIQVLDHGYVEFIEAWGRGRDARAKGSYEIQASETTREEIYEPDYEIGIIEAARQSTQGNFRGWEEDQKLLAYLHNNKHATPFEFSGLVIEVQAPIFVFREWHRHRTQSYNEMSARYAPLPDLHYIPDYEVVLERAKAISKNNQAKGIAVLQDEEDVGHWLDALDECYTKCEFLYKRALEKGIPKELARLSMPVGHYSRMRVSANLRNWLSFLTLRQDPAAQWEIRQFAHAVANTIEKTFPKTWELYRGSK